MPVKELHYETEPCANGWRVVIAEHYRNREGDWDYYSTNVDGRTYATQAQAAAIANYLELQTSHAQMIKSLVNIIDQAGDIYPYFQNPRGEKNINAAKTAIKEAMAVAETICKADTGVPAYENGHDNLVLASRLQMGANSHALREHQHIAATMRTAACQLTEAQKAIQAFCKFWDNEVTPDEKRTNLGEALLPFVHGLGRQLPPLPSEDGDA